MMTGPPAKRQKIAPSVGGEGSTLPGSRMLHQTVLVMLFLVRVGARSTDAVTASLSQIGSIVQAHVDSAFHKYHEMISCKLENVQGQIEGLRHEVRQLTLLHSNRWADHPIRVQPNQEHTAADGSNSSTRLSFQNVLRSPIYTDKNIITEDNAGIKVAIFEGDTMITSGPLSRAKVEILVLRGDFTNKCGQNWTTEDFDKHVVQGRDGKDLVLGSARLINGEVELSQIRFKEGSCRTSSRKFTVAARVCWDGKTAIRVHEAIMEPVTVLDRRNESNKKSHPPRLHDDVYRLEKISKNGDYHKRLQEAQIYTVEDFLKALNKDPDNLCKVLKMNSQHNSWSKLTKHAREYVLEDRQELKPYLSEDGSVMLLFNCVYDLVGAMYFGDYVASENFDSHLKVLTNKLKDQAYNILEDIPPTYVMKGNIPEQICSGQDLPPDEFNHVTQVSYPNATHLTTTASIDPFTRYYQGTGTPLLGKQQMVTNSIVPQQDAQRRTEASPFEFASTHGFQPNGFSGASTSSQLNIEPHHLLPQPHLKAPVTVPPAWTTTTSQTQPWNDEHEQEPGCSFIP
ncbi:hypothetical protein EJB05_01183 [Eragrostis curvula]|uniref:Calmodulin-binding protein n=1 Tax=Eragrostis curvula TaxID=38414 RepID=A0A5J9WPN1_9POAL|nr:hypothetical protein EJB05_01183 [Eragrostis curvula]